MSKKKNIAYEQLRRCSTQKGGYRSRGRICVSPFARSHEDGGPSPSDDSKIGKQGVGKCCCRIETAARPT